MNVSVTCTEMYGVNVSVSVCDMKTESMEEGTVA